MAAREPQRDSKWRIEEGDLSAAEFNDGAVIRKSCESNPLKHEEQLKHLRALRAGALAIRAEVAQFPGVMNLLLRHEFEGADFSQREELTRAAGYTAALWERRGEPGWQEAYADQQRQNSQRVLQAFDELFLLSERPYADIIAIEGQVKEICRGASSVNGSTSSTNRSELESLYEKMALRPFTEILSSARLIEEIEKQIAPSRNVMVESNLRLVAHAVAGFKTHGGHKGIDAPGSLDLFQEGVFGLLAAIDRFDPERGFRFSTYALWWVNQAIGKSLKQDEMIELPNHVKLLFGRERRARTELLCELGTEPRDDEVYARMGLSPREEKTLKQAKRTLIVSSRVRVEGEEVDVFEQIADPESRQHEQVEAGEVHERVIRALNRLFEERNRWIMEQRLSSGQRKPPQRGTPTYAEIGEGLELSRQRVCQIERIGLSVLIDYFMVDTARPAERLDVLERFLAPTERKLIFNLLSEHYDPVADKAVQSAALKKTAAILAIRSLGESQWTALAQEHGLSAGRTFVVRDRIFGGHDDMDVTAHRAVTAGVGSAGRFDGKDAHRMFEAAIRQAAPALRSEFQRRNGWG